MCIFVQVGPKILVWCIMRDTLPTAEILSGKKAWVSMVLYLKKKKN